MTIKAKFLSVLLLTINKYGGWGQKALLTTHVVCLGITTSFWSCAVQAKVTIVYTSNQPDILFEKSNAHFPQLSTLLKTLKEKEGESTLFLHGGDSFSPSAMSLFDNANNIIALANMMDVSLFAVGKRELTYDVDILSLRAHDAQFPIVSSNVLDNRTHQSIEGLFSTYEFEVEDTRISVASIINPRVLVTYAPQYAEIETMDIVFKEISKAQKEADLKILMTDLEQDASIAIAREQDFDLILVAIDGPDKIITEGNTQIVLGGGQDGDTVIIEYDLTNNQLSTRTESLDKYFPDPQILAFIEKYQARLGRLYDEKIAVSNSEFTTQKHIIRTRETALGNVFVDALRAKAKTEIAILNSGAIRNSAIYHKGYQFTRGDIQREFPFGGHHVTIEIIGSEIIAMMENALSRIEFLDGRFLNVSGMNITYDSSAPTGERVRSINIAKQPLNQTRLYSMAIPDFYLKGGDDYKMLGNKVPISSTFNKPRSWHVVADYFFQKKTISAPALNRMVDLTN